jgi:6-phosphofructokinase 1
MANVKKGKGVIGILTGGGDVPGLNPAIRKAGRTGGTFLHTSRTRPSHVKKSDVPEALRGTYNNEYNDLTPEVLKNLEWLGMDYLIPIGGDDTLSYGVRLYQEGMKVVAIPKTMDNDVPGTDYCIGFSTCVTRTIQMTNSLRTSAGSHERFLVLEVFGRYAGYTAMLPTMAGAANRCVIPEHKFDIERLTDLMVYDRKKNPSRYSVVLVSEGAMFEGGEMVFESDVKDSYGHAKLGGIGDLVSQRLKDLSPKFNNGQKVEVINQKLGYLVRGGDPLVVLKNGRYDNVPIDMVTSSKKVVHVKEHYNTERYRPHYRSFEMKPLFLMTSEI